MSILPESVAAEKDRPRFGDGRKCLFIASEVRCGSTFVGETLAYELNKSCGYHLWGLTKEPFSFVNYESKPEEILNTWSALYLDGSGFVAAKLMVKALSHIHRLAENTPELREAFFGDHARWIVVRRGDRIEQAVSLAMALKTKTFHYYGDPSLSEDNNTELTIAEIDWAVKSVAMSDIYLQALAASLPSERSVAMHYKDFVADQAGYIEKVHEICGFPAFDRATYVNDSKLQPTGRDAKKRYAEQFRQWYLAHHG